MVEKCSYCGEVGHSIQQCPKWKHSSAERIARVSMPIPELSKKIDDMLAHVKTQRFQPLLSDVFEFLWKIGDFHRELYAYFRETRKDIYDTIFHNIIGEVCYGTVLAYEDKWAEAEAQFKKAKERLYSDGELKVPLRRPE